MSTGNEPSLATWTLVVPFVVAFLVRVTGSRSCCCRCSNVAEALVSKGLATVVRYRQGDDQRSSCYDDLLRAEDRAEKKAVGVHSKKDSPVIRVADVSGVSHSATVVAWVTLVLQQGVPRRQPHHRSGLATLSYVGAVP